ncbi:Mitochondrial brown fat uncoupling protein [Artemisia annua]|uniref:Mitochondrial brown fat uncoupling protein n=1 Tax=Artemisia annua TaxID=35608 RepID=A0A2U1LMW0_ARTAN|nr:Mitochondrial brown fat uncoupling protein [Artemisia annua]
MCLMNCLRFGVADRITELGIVVVRVRLADRITELGGVDVVTVQGTTDVECPPKERHIRIMILGLTFVINIFGGFGAYHVLMNCLRFGVADRITELGIVVVRVGLADRITELRKGGNTLLARAWTPTWSNVDKAIATLSNGFDSKSYREKGGNTLLARAWTPTWSNVDKAIATPSNGFDSKSYRGPLNVVVGIEGGCLRHQVVKQEGVTSLRKVSSLTVHRPMIVTPSQPAAYDKIKETILAKVVMEDGLDTCDSEFCRKITQLRRKCRWHYTIAYHTGYLSNLSVVIINVHQVVKQEGVTSLRKVHPFNVHRPMIVTPSQPAAYDKIKETILAKL